MQDPNLKATEKLIKITKGEVKNLTVDPNAIVTGKRMKNAIMRKFADSYKKDAKLDDATILRLVLAIDEAVEKEYLTDELLDYLNKNPEKLNELLTKQK